MEICKQQKGNGDMQAANQIETRHLPAVDRFNGYGVMWAADRFKRYGR